MMNISILILAAGASSRMGQPKQLLGWGGIPLVRLVAMQALALHPFEVVVVTGASHPAVSSAVAELALRVIENPEYAAGQSTSLRCGIQALSSAADAVLVLLGDTPFVTSALMQQLIDAATSNDLPIVAPRYRGTRGNPVLFRRPLFEALARIEGDQGARTILAAHPDQIQYVDIDDDRPLIDIDTPELYAMYKPPTLALRAEL
jgi:molybdenum cofactor cytidylyltransferase